MKLIYTVVFSLLTYCSIAQIAQPIRINNGQTVDFNLSTTRALGDSCGAYYNNYIGMNKTNIIQQEYLRNNPSNPNSYSGRAQKFEAPQPIEVSGVEFYAFIDNMPSVTSVMVITMLNEYDAIADSVGVEIIRDTVYVTHTGNSGNPVPPLPNISVQSVFDSAITVNDDYIVSIFTPNDDPLIIITNDFNENAGNGENLSFALYSYTGYPTYPPGWYAQLNDFGYDYDYLIAPKIKYDLNDSFILDDDSICPGIAGNACVTYNQMPIFSNGQYNSNASNNQSAIRWLWDDGTFNAGLTNACHTYQNSGTYELNLQDTIYKWDYNTNFCLSSVTSNVVALDSVMPDFTFTNTNVVVDFTSTATFADSVWWDFGNDSIIGGVLNPSMAYESVGTFDVWLHVVNECTEDSIMYQVTTDDVGINEFNTNLVNIYPNPANSELTFDKLPENAVISIYTMAGELVLNTGKLSETMLTINVSDLTVGTYVVKIASAETLSIQKILVTH